MISRLICTGLLLFTSASSVAFPQDGRVTVANPADKELKRTAHRLRIPVSQLRNARELLRQATSLARSLDPVPVHRMGNLAQLWVQFDRPKAAGSLESLLDFLRSAAGKAQDLASFQQISVAFQGILQPLSELESDKADQEAQQWPNPPQSLGQGAADLREQMIDQTRRQFLQQLIFQDPVKAAGLYADLGPSAGMDYYTPGQLALQLANAGKTDQAYKLVDQVIASYQSQPPSYNRFQNFVGFIQQLAGLDPDRFTQALSLVTSQPDMATPPSSGATLKVGDRSVHLDGFDLRMLDVFRQLSGRPALLEKALNSLTALKAKLDAIGGIDNALNPSLAAGGSYSIVYPNNGGVIQSGSQPVQGDKVSVLFRELKGKAAKNPQSARRKLSDAVKGPDDVDLLLRLAQMSCYEDPDLGSLAIEAARPLVLQFQPLLRRSMLLRTLVQTSRQCDGDVDTDLLREGFILADELRQDEKSRNPDAAERRDGNSQADHLEQDLLAQVAVDQYQAAAKYLSSMPDDEAKFAAELRVLSALRQPY